MFTTWNFSPAAGTIPTATLVAVRSSGPQNATVPTGSPRFGFFRSCLLQGPAIRRYLRTLLVAGSKEGEHVPVGIGDLEAPEAGIDERQLLHEGCTSLLELVEQRAGLHRAIVVGQAADLDRRPIAEQVSDGHPRAVYERVRSRR